MLSDICVGSSKKKSDDIIPCTLVSLNKSGQATVKNGFLEIDNTPAYKLSEIKSLSKKGTYRPDDNTTTSEDFVMEPGRTMFSNVKVCNKVEVCSLKFVNSVVVTNQNSVLKTSENGKPLKALIGQSTKRRKRDLTTVSVETPSGMFLSLVARKSFFGVCDRQALS